MDDGTGAGPAGPVPAVAGDGAGRSSRPRPGRSTAPPSAASAPGEADVRARVADAKRRRAWAEAEALLRQQLAAAPQDPYWRASYADLLRRRGEPGEAVALADDVLAAHPGFAPALLARGLACERLGRLREAAEALAAAWAAAPTAYAAQQLARVRAQTDGAAAALALVEDALVRFPADAGLLKRRALLHERLGDAGRAAAAYREALDAAPADDFAFARLLRAQLAGRPPDEALAELEPVLRLPSRAASPHLRALRAELLEAAGRDEEALAAWEAAREADPGNAYLRARLAFACRRAGRRERALSLLQAVLEDDPADAAALSAFVADAVALGRQAGARAFLLGLVERHPDRRSLWGWVRRLERATGSPAPRRPGAGTRARPPGARGGPSPPQRDPA